jgi:hypothetical protein
VNKCRKCTKSVILMYTFWFVKRRVSTFIIFSLGGGVYEFSFLSDIELLMLPLISPLMQFWCKISVNYHDYGHKTLISFLCEWVKSLLIKNRNYDITKELQYHFNLFPEWRLINCPIHVENQCYTAKLRRSQCMLNACY